MHLSMHHYILLSVHFLKSCIVLYDFTIIFPILHYWTFRYSNFMNSYFDDIANPLLPKVGRN